MGVVGQTLPPSSPAAGAEVTVAQASPASALKPLEPPPSPPSVLLDGIQNHQQEWFD